MKTLLAYLCLAMAFSAGTKSHANPIHRSAADKPTAPVAPVIDYFVSKSSADKEMLEKVFERIREMESKDNPELLHYEVLRKLSNLELLVYKKKWVRNPTPPGDRLSQIGGYYGSGSNQTTYHQETDISIIYCLVTKKPLNAADGEAIKNLETVETSEVRSDGMGGNYRVLQAKENPEAEPFTKEIFVKKLKEGKTWMLPRQAKVDCHTCAGKGTMGALQKNAQCRDCAGAGKTFVDYRVKW